MYPEDKPVVSLVAENEETIDVQVNGASVGTLTHADLGWGGLAAASEVVRSLAAALGAEVEQREDW